MSDRAIIEFSGAFRFLSNFWPATVEYEGEIYPSVEHAYQAAKSLDLEVRTEIRRAYSARVAKRRGRRITLREDWDDIKIDVMRELLKRKFLDPALRAQLRETGNALLIEGNTWGDTFWGESPLGVGKNHLGKLLMETRAEIQNQEEGGDRG